jgi:hypothetical protein
MGILRFYLKVLKVAFTHSLERADLVGGVVAILGGAYAYFNQDLAELIGIGNWLIPAVFFLFLFTSRLILAPYWIYMEESERASSLASMLHELEAGSPRILFKVSKQAQMYRPSPVTNQKIPTYELLQAWFENRPIYPSDNSTALQLSALIQIISHPSGEMLYEVHGHWAKSTAPSHVGFSGTTPTIDLPPGSLNAKLMVALKHKSDDAAYVYTEESLRKHVDGRNSSLILEPGDYRVSIELRGIRFDGSYEFLLVNRGANESLRLELFDLTDA